MIKTLLHFTMALLLAGMFCGACSDNTGGESEKGAIRKMTDQVADEMVHKMRNPIDKARSVRDQEEDRLSEVEEAAEETSQTD